MEDQPGGNLQDPAEETQACGACGGTGTRRRRLDFLVAGGLLVAAVVCDLGANAFREAIPDPTAQPIATQQEDTISMLLGAGFAAGYLLSFVGLIVMLWRIARGRCRVCGGTGYVSAPLLPLNLDWPETKEVFQGRRCRHCHYDLSGLTTDRCPECGTAILDTQPR